MVSTSTDEPNVSTGPPGFDSRRADGVHGGSVRSASTQQLIGRIIRDLSDLVDRQIEMAKQEVRADIGNAVGAVKTLAIGAGIGVAAALLLVIWAWTAFIWFFNWVGVHVWDPYGGVLGWILGLLVPLIAAFIAYSRFIKPGVSRVKRLPLQQTRATLKEDLEWARTLRTRGGG